MATAIGTSWTKLGERSYQNSRIGSGYTFKVSLWAKYRDVSGNTCIVDYKTVLSSPYAWTESAGSAGTSWKHISGSSAVDTIEYAPWSTKWTFPRGDVDLISVSSSRITGGTTVNVTGSYRSAFLQFGEDFTAQGTLPNWQVAPSGISVTVGAKTSNAVVLSINVASYGNPDSSAAGAYNEVALLGQNSYGSLYRYARGSFIVAASVDNDATGDLTIESNTQYWYGGSAFNSLLTTSVVSGQVWTLPEKPVGSQFQKTGDTSAAFSITETSVGTGRAVQLQYRYKSGSASEYGEWTNAGSPGNNQTEQVSLTGLPINEVFDVEVRSVAGEDYSGVNSYPEAFSTRLVSVSITSTTDSYDSTADPYFCKTTLNYIISSSGDEQSTYDIEISCTTSDSLTPTHTPTTISIQGSTNTGSASINLLPGRTYTFTAHAKKTEDVSWGPYNIWQKVAPSFVPNAPYISDIAFSDVRDSFSCRITPATPGSGEILDYISWTAEIYRESTGQWGVLSSGTLTASGVINVPKTVGADVSDYSKLRVRTTQTNTIGNVSPESVVTFKNRPRIWGKVIRSADRLNIVNIRVKDTTGTLSAGNITSPFVIK